MNKLVVSDWFVYSVCAAAVLYCAAVPFLWNL